LLLLLLLLLLLPLHKVQADLVSFQVGHTYVRSV
jgi:hypothetical protein